MNQAKQKAQALAECYHTAEPSELCEILGITVLRQELPRCVNGFTVRMNDLPFIVLNRDLDFYESRFTMAHELGHVVLHKGTNSLNLSLNTDFCVNRYEREADSFAAWLLMQAEMAELEAMESVTAEDVSKIAHIPLSVADSAFLC